MSCGDHPGKYRGRVADNVDPLFLGRLLVEVPQIPAVVFTWAMPCVPYAGPNVGFYMIPPIGANVWVEFEGGDVNYPIWVGCFWSEGETPIPALPLFKIIQTATSTFLLNDTPGEGGITLLTRDPAVEVPALLNMDSAGIQLLVEPAAISLSPEAGITVAYPPSSVLLDEAGITVTTGATMTMGAAENASFSAGAAVEIGAGGDLSASSGAVLTIEAGGDVGVSAGGAAEVEAGANLALSAAGAVEVDAVGDVTIAAVGIVDMEALDVAITGGAVEVTAAGIALTGATEASGDLLIDGMQPVVLP